MSTSSFPPFEREYDADVLAELPAGRIRYFPDASRSEAPLLLRFTLSDGSSWVGGFGAGTLAARACTGVFASPCSKRACVVSRGRAYAVDVEEPEKTMVVIPELVMQVVPDVAAGLLLIADPWQLYAYAEDGLRWSTGKISIEGLKILAADQRTTLVCIEDADGEAAERAIDVRTGRVV